MELNEIKKRLYKENPKATCNKIQKGFIYYETSFESGEPVYFKIPFEDLGDAILKTDEEAKYLIRWIVI